MKLAWITDPHFNFLNELYATLEEAVRALTHDIKALSPDALLLTGDLDEAKGDALFKVLEVLAKELGIPVYFVLGNHDFYGGSLRAVRNAVAEMEERVGSKKDHFKLLKYLTVKTQPIRLGENTALIGHDGWADGREGVIDEKMSMNDNNRIQDLMPLTSRLRLQKMAELGDEAAAHIKSQLQTALTEYGNVILAIHTPPFKGACAHQGDPSKHEAWLPYLVCKAVGDVIINIMGKIEHANKTLRVYCGHTHEEVTFEPLPNVRVFVGGAKYREMATPQIIEV